MWQDTQKLCHENNNGIAELCEGVADLRKDHEGKKFFVLLELAKLTVY